jgi:2-methylcitrate dehydratase PrpD
MMPDSISRQLARFAVGLAFDDLPPAVVDKAKALALQGLVSALAGHPHPGARRIVELIKAEERTVGRGSTILVDGARVTKAGAAFATAEMIHRGARLDVYRMLTHPGTSILPAAFVAAESAGRTGGDLITALAIGYEVQARLAGDWIPSTQARGFRSSPIFGIFGAATAAGRLMGLDEDEMVTTIALCVELASGNLEGARTGSNSFTIHEPSAARNGLLAVLLSRAGIRGTETSLEGEAGFYHAHTGSNAGALTYAFGDATETSYDGITSGLGSRWETLDTALRIYDAAGYNVPLVEVTAQLCRDHGIQPDDVASVEVEVNRHEMLYPSPAFPSARPAVPKPGGAEYYTAFGILERGYPIGRARPAGGSGPAADDPPGLAAMMGRIRVAPSATRPVMAPLVTIRTHDGTTYSITSTGRELMLDLAEATRRMRDLAPTLPINLERFEALVDAVTGLDRLPRADRLVELTLLDPDGWAAEPA